MADSLWPDPKTVLNNTSSAGVKMPSSSSLWPDPAQAIGKPTHTFEPPTTPGTNYFDPNLGRLQTTHNPAIDNNSTQETGLFKRSVSTGAGLVGDYFKQFVAPFTKPSEQEQAIEKSVLPTSSNSFLNTVQAPARFVLKGALRGLTPVSEGLGNQIASIQIDKETADNLNKNKEIQKIGKQTQSNYGSTPLNVNKATPTDFVMAVLNSANFALPIAGAVTDVLGFGGNKLTTRGTEIKVTPEQIKTVLESDKPMPPEARVVLQHFVDNGQGFDMSFKRPAGGLRQTIGEALQGQKIGTTLPSDYKITPTGDINPQIAGPEPFAHENVPGAFDIAENTRGVQPFAHEQTIAEPRPSPFAHELAGAVGGSAPQIFQGMANTYGPTDMSQAGKEMFGQPSGTGQSLAERAGASYDEVGVLAQASKSIETRRDARKVLNILSGNVDDSVKVDKLLQLNNNLESPIGSPERSILENAINKMLPSKIPSGDITLNMELVPGLSQTITEDIIPKAKGAATRIGDMYKELATLINPTGQVDPAALDIIMKNKGDFERKVFRAEQTQKAIKNAWDKQPEENRLAFMEKVETGQIIDGENKALADSYRERLNNAYATIAKYKEGVNFLENYFPHFWQKPEQVTKNFVPEIMARRPLEGNKSFLKQRIFQTIQEGIEAGYKPITTNPEELMQIYEQSVAKFEMAQKIKLDLKAAGMWKVIQHGKPLPPGYTYINDPIARAFFPQGEIQTPEGSQKHFAEIGRAAAPTPVARLINNHLSPDLLSTSPTFRTFMQAKNALNAIQLGFSGFHVLFTTLDSTITGVDVGISKLARGDFLGAAKEFAKAPFNAYTFFRDGQKFFNGDPELLKIEQDLFRGGASLKERQYYKNQVFDRFIANVKQGNVVGALGRMPMAMIEGMMRPLFSYYIPRLKVGAFRELFANELERYSKRGELGVKKSRETIAREVWNNIENRLGELNYDNLFWNRNFKAANMGMWRAVGWNLGTIREIGGATTQDFASFVNEARKGNKPDLTPKMRYTLALLFVMATIGSIYEYLHTGHRPKSFKDMFYPENGATDQNGDPVRVQFPSYLKDMYAYTHHPTRTIGDKLSPELSILIDLWTNEDYYGNYVYDPKAGLPQKTGESLKFILKQIRPFTISNIVQLQKGKSTTAEQAESFLGIQKSPQDISQSERTKAIFDNLQKQGPKTPDEQKLSQLKNQYRKQIQNGNMPSLEELVNAGVVKDAKGYRAFIKAAQLTPTERAYKTLPKDKKSTIPTE